jgi:2-keto-4-pentenoate hydratase/2-oxohepta-3-ene-1,7-dioic acid hydratase in catechol pathway
MRIANLEGRLVLLRSDMALDVERASDGRFVADPQAIYDRWEEFVDWAATAPEGPVTTLDQDLLGSPAPRPAQVFAIGLNYSDHAMEAGFEVPDVDPPVFTKFVSCLTGPRGDIRLPPDGNTDWEVELVVIIGQTAFEVARHGAWSHVAGLSVGQDLSERKSQMAGPSPQFSLAKSFPGFGPVGPWLVTPDEVDDPDNLAIEASINGETVQSGRTNQLIFDVPSIIEKLSAVVTLSPGDLIFTGTPAGVGMGRTPPRWLTEGDELVSSIEGIGELRHRFVS